MAVVHVVGHDRELVYDSSLSSKDVVRLAAAHDNGMFGADDLKKIPQPYRTSLGWGLEFRGRCYWTRLQENVHGS